MGKDISVVDVGLVLLSDLYHVLTMVSVVVLSKLDFFLPCTCSKQVAAQGTVSWSTRCKASFVSVWKPFRRYKTNY